MLRFSELAKEAHALLNSESKEQKLSFQKSKNAIKQLFVSSEIPYKQLVLLRLGIIDDFYSTNINKSNDAIFILSDDIVNIGDDKVLKEKFMHFYNDEKCIDKDILRLFDTNRGWIFNKSAQKIKNGNKSISLISKYAYFLTDFNFPIYDSTMRKILEKFGKKVKDEDIVQYFRAVKDLCDSNKISVDELDACGWLMGKMEEALKINSSKASFIGEISAYSNFYNKAQNYFRNRF